MDIYFSGRESSLYNDRRTCNIERSESFELYLSRGDGFLLVYIWENIILFKLKLKILSKILIKEVKK